MRQTKAKALRKAVYGDQSRREREYKTVGGTVVCVGLRGQYLNAKGLYKRGLIPRNGI